MASSMEEGISSLVTNPPPLVHSPLSKYFDPPLVHKWNLKKKPEVNNFVFFFAPIVKSSAYKQYSPALKASLLKVQCVRLEKNE